MSPTSVKALAAVTGSGAVLASLNGLPHPYNAFAVVAITAFGVFINWAKAHPTTCSKGASMANDLTLNVAVKVGGKTVYTDTINYPVPSQIQAGLAIAEAITGVVPQIEFDATIADAPAPVSA